MFLSGNEAVALAARDCGVALGIGYPGTPSTEILERFAALGGRAQWSPNEKVALEVAIGVAYAGAGALVTMKHVGLNVAADPLFTVAYTGVSGPLVIVATDDPGMASSQNEQDSRRYTVAADVPMLEPADSQEAYDFTRLAIKLSRQWKLPFLLRMTTRVCHSSAVMRLGAPFTPPAPYFERDIAGRVMIPAYARPAHRRLRDKVQALQSWNEAQGPSRIVEGSGALGIIASGVAFLHAVEAAPDAAIFKLGMTYPLPIESIRRFAHGVERCVAIEEGDPYLTDSLRGAGISVEGRSETDRFGELDVARVRRILAGDRSPEPPRPPGKAPELCKGCSHRSVFETLRELGWHSCGRHWLLFARLLAAI
jgi:indolepyruvate ferredoxin oxidoreductase alpha subunit